MNFELDRRLRPLRDNPDCFLCGKPIVHHEQGLDVETEMSFDIHLCCHEVCASRITMKQLVERHMATAMKIVDGMHV